MTQATAATLVRDGINAAKSGNKALARKLLRQATAQEPDHELGWLWLAGVAESPQEALDCLEHVLEVNPANEQARKGVHAVRLQVAVAQARAGNKQLARHHLVLLTDANPRDEMAWQWRAAVAESAQEAIQCLQRVLEINPNNQRAREGIDYYRSQLESASAEICCPFCAVEGEPNQVQCPSCGALLSLADADAFFGDGVAVDEEKLENAVAHYRGALHGDGHPTVHYYLGLALLNLRRFDEGVPHLQAAMQRQPGDRSLRAQVNQFLRRKVAADAAAAERARQERDNQLCILIVDDSPTVRKLVGMTLERQGYRVLEAGDGYEAADRIRQKTPNLILLDITMPGPDGYEVCRIIKQNPETSAIPVVMLSGKDGFFDKIRGRLCGSTAYITKPFKPDGLLQVVGKYCRPLARGAMA